LLSYFEIISVYFVSSAKQKYASFRGIMPRFWAGHGDLPDRWREAQALFLLHSQGILTAERNFDVEPGDPSMTYHLTFHQEPTYLHVIVTGENTKENVRNYLAEVLRECEKRSLSRVLIEERLNGARLELLEVFRIVAETGAMVRGKLDAIAYVDVFAQGDTMRFAETVAVNRAVPAMVFAAVPEAVRWLQNER
jgi:hypothetical protein